MVAKMGLGAKVAAGVAAVAIGAASLTALAPDLPIGGTFTPDFARNIIRDTTAALVDPSVPKIVNVGAYSCAGYAVRAAEKYTNNEYAQGDAWELPAKGSNIKVWEGSAFSLEDLSAQLEETGQKLMPGDILGIYNESSHFNNASRPYTHTAVYIGNGKIVHQNWLLVMKSDLDGFIDYSNRAGKAFGLEDKVEIKTVTRAAAGNNNDFRLKELVPGFYKSIQE
jgi:hypothetical protein